MSGTARTADLFEGDQAPAGLPDNRLTEPLAAQFDRVPADWRPLTDAFRRSDRGQALIARVDAARQSGHTLYPGDVLAALRLTRRDEVRVVILGQDPYHGPNQAHGLAFSVRAGVKIPPSLRNIFKELQRDLGLTAPASGELTAWAERGVCLLNTSLTVEAECAGSHAGWGWEDLTDTLIEAMARDAQPKVFMLWGAHAQRKAPLIEVAGSGHLILQCNHPSPLSASRGPAPFIGCGHFGQAAAFLSATGRPLSWRLDPPV
ncbi:MAG TPA: uracil-DNA glycosylase [Aquabacterium sp.]|uniref:uracil-DNA glycosylase n=1 Tax=Aquabacterium sp. TaxID=1872578 RepID=UPI002D96AAFC|nr:uracil-DNA glycosylase [Aquabacterium sp.]HET6788528.1 uracil-DNA glycosylase [Aquabacterium sp.]HEX5372954.1 uracil-DNA glycosylase [Aquabacterium sp.]